FSQVGIDVARAVADEIGFPDARFIRSDLYELPDVLQGDFDVVYTSRGVLGWLPDIRRWADVAAHFVRPGGRFYITEIHPVAQVFENEGVAPGELRLAYPYWEHAEPLALPVKGSYADKTGDFPERTEYGWDHSLGEIVTALIDAGLVLRSLREYPWVDWKLEFLVQAPDGTWRLPPGTPGELPLFFSLLATKPATGQAG
ncbi:MAG: class I SAM-dependent methyltransferase, partial [Chloroflexota bacterium]|nr:class I SAM-dependent methyltransferase [Chloroflexota bacterium]